MQRSLNHYIGLFKKQDSQPASMRHPRFYSGCDPVVYGHHHDLLTSLFLQINSTIHIAFPFNKQTNNSQRLNAK